MGWVKGKARTPLTQEEINCKTIREIVSKLYNAFDWGQSPQGVLYWAEVAKNLKNIADSM